MATLFGVIPPPLDMRFACDNDETRRVFMMDKFPHIPLMMGDCEQFSSMMNLFGFKTAVRNMLTNEQARLDPVGLYGSGFSCKSLSNVNKNRANHKGACRSGRGTTGETFSHQHSFITKMKPKVSVLENGPNLAHEAALENGEMGSDLDFLIEEFE